MDFGSPSDNLWRGKGHAHRPSLTNTPIGHSIPALEGLLRCTTSIDYSNAVGGFRRLGANKKYGFGHVAPTTIRSRLRLQDGFTRRLVFLVFCSRQEMLMRFLGRIFLSALPVGEYYHTADP